MCKIAENETAAKFKELQALIDLCISDQEQLELMLKIKEELLKAESSTPIFDWRAYNMEKGKRIITTAGEMVASLNRRISRFQDQVRLAIG